MIPPPQMNNAERWCYLCLADLYQKHKDKKIDTQYAVCEKNKIQTEYRHDCMLREMFEACSRRELAIRKIASDIERNGTDRERLLVAILDGRVSPRTVI